MGYWAKDGSYVYDEHDEPNSLTETQQWEASKRFAERMEEEEKAKAAREESERAFRVANAENDRVILKNKIEKERKLRKKAEDMAYSNDPMLWLRKPRDLNERRARANYWLKLNTFTLLVNRINGKYQKMSKLWDDYSHAETEAEKQAIVDQMEKMFPTTDKRLKAAEKQEGRGR